MVTEQIIDNTQKTGRITAEDLELMKTLASLHEAPEPEPEDSVVHRGDESVPAPIMRTKSTSAGYTLLRRNSDGQLREVNNNQLADRLRMKLPDGRPAWLAPTAPWSGKSKVGHTLCMLHPNHPDRALMDSLFLPECRKDTLSNNDALRRHMQRKHRSSWEAIQQHKTDEREQQRDEAQRMIAESLAGLGRGMVTHQPLPAPDTKAQTRVRKQKKEKVQRDRTPEEIEAAKARMAKARAARGKTEALTSVAESTGGW